MLILSYFMCVSYGLDGLSADAAYYVPELAYHNSIPHFDFIKLNTHIPIQKYDKHTAPTKT